MGSDSSKTDIEVKNKDYDPAKQYHDSQTGKPMFSKTPPAQLQKYAVTQPVHSTDHEHGSSQGNTKNKKDKKPDLMSRILTIESVNSEVVGD